MERQGAAKAQKSPVVGGRPPARSARSSVATHPLLELQRSIGNQAVQRLINSPFIQAKLQVSTPDDPSEQEADRVADTVMRMPEPAVTRPLIQRVPLAVREDDDDEEEVQRHADGTSAPNVTTSVASSIQAMNGGGSPLPETTRSFFESRFGADFGAVRVHTDSRAAETARSINARAFTVGQNIAFSPGLYAPHSQQGQQLLAHELTHVIQQRGAQHQVHRSPDPPPAGPPPGGGGGPPASGRVVYIDANVVNQINRGNTNVANSLRAMRTAGVDIRIPPYQYAELVVNPEIPRTATSQRLILEEMNIRPGASPNLMQRVDVNLAGQTRSGSNIMQHGDQQLVASARADGRNVEIWSLDTPFRSNPRQVETTYGVRIAPESQLPLSTRQSDYRVGRALLGLEPVEISLTGQVTRGTPPGGGGGGGGGTPPGPPTPPAPGTTGASSFSTGTRVVAGGMALIVVINEILGGINRVRGIQQQNIDMGKASIAFWERFGAHPKSAVWDLHGGGPLPPGSKASTSVLGSPSFPYVVDIDVNALRNNLASNIKSYQDFLYFLDAGKMVGNIEEDPPMPENPNQAQRAQARSYFAWVNLPDRANRRVYDITGIVTEVRNAALGELDYSMRQQTAALSSAEQGNIYRLKKGADTEIYRSAGGRQRILTAQQIFGPDPWVRTLGRREDVGGWFSTDIRVLVVPANADAQRASVVSGYWVKQSIEDTFDEIKDSGRPIVDRQPPNGRLNSFVAGPEPGANSRFGETRYYRHPDPDMRWTIALGELRQFWVKASDLAPVSRDEIGTYTRQT